MSVSVNIPTALQQYTQNQSEVRVNAETLHEVLQRLDALFPGLKAFIVDENSALRRYVNIFVNDRDIRLGDGMTTKLSEGDRVRIVPAVAGG
jgi:MoaD family protein